MLMLRKLLIVLALPFLVAQGNSEDARQRHSICHATGSESNPYVLITPSEAGVFNGHLGDDHQDGEDIIPPFEYQGEEYSQNWPEGQTIFENDCEVPEEAPPATAPPTTTSSSTSTTSTSTTTTSTLAPPTSQPPGEAADEGPVSTTLPEGPQRTELPFTGSFEIALGIIGLGLLAGGIALLALRRLR